METTENRTNGQNAGPPAATPQNGGAQAGSGAPVSTPAVAKRKKSAKTAYFILGGLAAAVVGVYYGHNYLTRNQVSTDDAQIDADVVPVGARVGGPILKMNVKDNDLVTFDSKPGAPPPVIAVIDPAEYEAKVAAATAEEKAAHATLEQAQVQLQIVRATSGGGTAQARAQVAGSSAVVQSAAAQVAQAQAQVARAEADLGKAENDLARAQKLHDQGAVTGRELEAAQSARDAARAVVDGAKAGLTAARGMQSSASAGVAAAQGKLAQTTPEQDQIEAAQKAIDLASARWDSAKAQLGLATLQRHNTEIPAPAAGYVSRLAVHEGQLVMPGQTLLMLVPNDTYVVANFKETQLGRIKPGQTVDVSVDALPGKSFEGVVDSIAPGTGARFSLLPPDNATGNFVKVVQRVPVKIKWKSPPGAELRAGLSAEVTIHLE